MFMTGSLCLAFGKFILFHLFNQDDGLIDLWLTKFLMKMCITYKKQEYDKKFQRNGLEIQSVWSFIFFIKFLFPFSLKNCR